MTIPRPGYAIGFSASPEDLLVEGLLLKLEQTANIEQRREGARKISYLVSWPRESFEDSIEFAGMVGNYKSRKCYVDGVQKPWDELYGFALCWLMRKKARKKKKFCFGLTLKRPTLWGCWSCGHAFYWSPWSNWFNFGHFSQDAKGVTLWVFDKERIHRELLLSLKKYSGCPHSRPALIEAVLNALPQEVELSEESGWGRGESKNNAPGSSGIVHKEKVGHMEFDVLYYSNGVIPIGFTAYKAILSKAIAEAGITDVTVDQLIK